MIRILGAIAFFAMVVIAFTDGRVWQWFLAPFRSDADSKCIHCGAEKDNPHGKYRCPICKRLSNYNSTEDESNS